MMEHWQQYMRQRMILCIHRKGASTTTTTNANAVFICKVARWPSQNDHWMKQE